MKYRKDEQMKELKNWRIEERKKKKKEKEFKNGTNDETKTKE